MLDQAVQRAPKRFARLPVSGTPAKDPAHAFWRICKHSLEPTIECDISKIPCLVVSRNLEQRVDAGLYRSLAQQVSAEGMDGAEPR
jgi:hypothetical protein